MDDVQRDRLKGMASTMEGSGTPVQVVRWQRTAADIVKVLAEEFPTLEKDELAMVAYQVTLLYARLSQLPLARISSVLDSSMSAYAMASAAFAEVYTLPVEVDGNTEPEKPVAKSTSNRPDQTGQYL